MHETIMSRKIILLIFTFTIAIIFIPDLEYLAQGFINQDPEPRKAPTAISENNIYVAWSSNKTGNNEVMFRASTDNGKTFGDKLNLSNSTASDSTRVEIAADGGNIIVTWWERNQTDDIPVAKTSNDFGKTFGPLLELGSNGTIGTGEAKPLL